MAPPSSFFFFFCCISLPQLPDSLHMGECMGMVQFAMFFKPGPWHHPQQGSDNLIPAFTPRSASAEAATDFFHIPSKSHSVPLYIHYHVHPIHSTTCKNSAQLHHPWFLHESPDPVLGFSPQPCRVGVRRLLSLMPDILHCRCTSPSATSPDHQVASGNSPQKPVDRFLSPDAAGDTQLDAMG